jgi:hypothetical protein
MMMMKRGLPKSNLCSQVLCWLDCPAGHATLQSPTRPCFASGGCNEWLPPLSGNPPRITTSTGKARPSWCLLSLVLCHLASTAIVKFTALLDDACTSKPLLRCHVLYGCLLNSITQGTEAPCGTVASLFGVFQVAWWWSLQRPLLESNTQALVVCMRQLSTLQAIRCCCTHAGLSLTFVMFTPTTMLSKSAGLMAVVL